jgi:hypothetical protein
MKNSLYLSTSKNERPESIECFKPIEFFYGPFSCEHNSKVKIKTETLSAPHIKRSKQKIAYHQHLHLCEYIEGRKLRWNEWNEEKEREKRKEWVVNEYTHAVDLLKKMHPNKIAKNKMKRITPLNGVIVTVTCCDLSSITDISGSLSSSLSRFSFISLKSIKSNQNRSFFVSKHRITHTNTLFYPFQKGTWSHCRFHRRHCQLLH